MRVPSGESAPRKAYGGSSRTGAPPFTGTVKSWLYRPLKTVRDDEKTIDCPSGVNPCTPSRPGCHVSRLGTPPATGTT